MKRQEENFIETEFVDFAEYRILGWNDFINGWVIEQRDLSKVVI